MDCKEAEKLIQPYVQGNMPEKEMEPFISHIRKCHTCHEELETYFIVNRAMAYFEDDAPDSYNLTGLLERDLEKKEEEARYRRYKDTFFRVFNLSDLKTNRVRRKNKNSQNSKQFSGRWTRCTVRRKKGIS